MTVYEECLIFKSWGQNDPNYYRAYVGLGLTADQYKEITGEDYVASTSESTSDSASSSTSASEPASASDVASASATASASDSASATVTAPEAAENN